MEGAFGGQWKPWVESSKRLGWVGFEPTINASKGEKTFSPVEPHEGSLLTLSPKRTQVRLKSLLYLRSSGLARSGEALVRRKPSGAARNQHRRARR